jgi:hypothetical protein
MHTNSPLLFLCFLQQFLEKGGNYMMALERKVLDI